MSPKWPLKGPLYGTVCCRPRRDTVEGTSVQTLASYQCEGIETECPGSFCKLQSFDCQILRYLDVSVFTVCVVMSS